MTAKCVDEHGVCPFKKTTGLFCLNLSFSFWTKVASHKENWQRQRSTTPSRCWVPRADFTSVLSGMLKPCCSAATSANEREIDLTGESLFRLYKRLLGLLVVFETTLRVSGLALLQQRCKILNVFACSSCLLTNIPCSWSKIQSWKTAFKGILARWRCPSQQIRGHPANLAFSISATSRV